MSRVAIQIGSISIYWYSLVLTLAFIIGGLLAIVEAKRKGISMDTMIDYFFYIIPFSLIGARIYFVIFNYDYYMNNLIEIFKVWEGGLAIHGGIIAGIIVTYYYGKKKGICFLKLTDIMVVSLILGQAIGRWGNFINQEAYGPATTLAELKSIHIPNFIIDGMNINGVYYQPTFFYESVFCLLGFIILYIVRRFKQTNKGTVTSFYLIWYGVIRFMIESLRQDSLMLFNFKVAQIVSICMIIVGIIIYIYSFRKGVKYE